MDDKEWKEEQEQLLNEVLPKLAECVISDKVLFWRHRRIGWEFIVKDSWYCEALRGTKGCQSYVSGKCKNAEYRRYVGCFKPVYCGDMLLSDKWAYFDTIYPLCPRKLSYNTVFHALSRYKLSDKELKAYGRMVLGYDTVRVLGGDRP